MTTKFQSDEKENEMCHIGRNNGINASGGGDVQNQGEHSSQYSEQNMSAGFQSEFMNNSMQGANADYSFNVDKSNNSQAVSKAGGSDGAGLGLLPGAFEQIFKELQEMIKSLMSLFNNGGIPTIAAEETPKSDSTEHEEVSIDGDDSSDAPESNNDVVPESIPGENITEENVNTSGLPENSADIDPSVLNAPSKSGIGEMDQWDDAIAKAAESTGLPANYIKATLYAESRGNADEQSTNPDGEHQDMGLMQISDYTYGLVTESQPDAPRNLDVNNPEENIMAGAWELKDKSENAGGDLYKTSAAYVGHGDSSDDVYAEAVMHFKDCLDNGQPLPDEYKGF